LVGNLAIHFDLRDRRLTVILEEQMIAPPDQARIETEYGQLTAERPRRAHRPSSYPVERRT
jgi:hypothetical protein